MEPRQLTPHLLSRRLKALADDLRQLSPDRLEAFHAMLNARETQWLTVDEVATELHVHRETVRRWIRGGQLKSVRAGRQHRIAPEALAEFLKESHP